MKKTWRSKQSDKPSNRYWIPKQSETVQRFLSFPAMHVLFQLNPGEVLQTCRISRDFNQYCKSEAFWKEYCEYVFGINVRRYDSSWKDNVMKYYTQLNRLAEDNRIIKMSTFSYVLNNLPYNEIDRLINIFSRGEFLCLDEVIVHFYTGHVIPSDLSFKQMKFKDPEDFKNKAEQYIRIPTRYYIHSSFLTINFDIDRYEIARILAYVLYEDTQPEESSNIENLLKKIFKLEIAKLESYSP